MAANITIAIEIANKEISDAFSTFLKKRPQVELIEWHNGVGEKGALASKVLPHVIVIDDAPQYGSLSERVSRLISAYPNVTVFVVSETQQPEKIVEAMKAGAEEFFGYPLQEQQIVKALDDVKEQVARNSELAKGRIFSFVSAKGGAGSTVLATNTSVAMGAKGKRSVALCDLSCQSGDSTVLLDL